MKLYRGRNYVLRSQDSLFGRKHLKQRENREFGPGKHTHASRACHVPRE